MQFKTDEQLRKYLTKKVERDIGGCGGWTFNGMRFANWSGYFTKEFYTYVGYVCDYKTLTVRLSKPYGGLSNECGLIDEKSFVCGENCISECITWTVDRLMEIYKLLNERTAPYADNKALYDLMVNRPIVLKEA